MPEPLRCRHVHTEGRQCGSPALRGEKLCYHHHAQRRPLARRAGTELIRPHLPHPEDLHAVQSGIAELLRLISMGHEDPKTHKLLLGTLALASANLARIERNRRAARLLALAEARFAARHPELARPAAQHPVILSEGEAQVEGPAVPTTEPGCPTPETGCPIFGAVSPRLRWDSDGFTDEPPVTDLVHDPELGAIAPGPDPDPRPEGRVPNPTPLLTPAPPMPTNEENLARWNRAVAKLQQTINLDAAADPTAEAVEPASPPSPRKSPRNPFRMLDHTPKTRKTTLRHSPKSAPASGKSNLHNSAHSVIVLQWMGHDEHRNCNHDCRARGAYTHRDLPDRYSPPTAGRP